MAARKILMALAFVLIGHTTAPAATLLTSPFDSVEITRGFARCLVTNGSAKQGGARVTEFDASGRVLASESTLVRPHVTDNSVAALAFNNTAESPAYCECTVPSAATWRCSFVYVDQFETPSVISIIEGR